MKTVYLSGPITGLNYEGAVNWRQAVIEALLPGIKGLSPMRDKQYLSDESAIKMHYSSSHHGAQSLSTREAIRLRDYYDATHADMVLAYLPKDLNSVGHLSYGTICEMSWARTAGVPVILVSDEPDVDHPIIAENVTIRLPDLDEAVKLINSTFAPYVEDSYEANRIVELSVPPEIQAVLSREAQAGGNVDVTGPQPDGPDASSAVGTTD